MHINNQIKYYREKNNYSQEKLAEFMGVSRQAVGKWEDSTIPELDKLIELAKLFHISLDQLVMDKTESGSVIKFSIEGVIKFE